MEGVKRCSVILAVAGCFVIVAIVACLVLPREKEPEYNGKKLSEWLASYAAAESVSDDPAAVVSVRQTAAGVVRLIGTNALPCLLRWVPSRDSRWRTNLFAVAQRLPGFLRYSSVVRGLDPQRPERRENLALFGFGLLGESGAPAIPELTRMMNGVTDQVTSVKAMWCLSYIGNAARPALRASAALNSSDPILREVATNALVGIEREQKLWFWLER